MKLCRRQLIRIIGLVSLLHIAWEREAHAYLDPGSASYALQMAIAAAVAAGFVIKTYWAKLKSLLGGSASPSARPEKAPDDSPTGDTPSR